ncbi:MAG: lipocalin family protein [Opitutus sp.]
MSSANNLHSVSYVDLDRYLGRWYVISHVPYFLENGKVGTSDNYARRPDGKLDAIFAFRKESLTAPEKTWNGVAEITDPKTNAEWKVSFVWPISATYRVLELDPDYRWAVVSNGNGKLVWVLARETSLPDAQYQDILRRVTAQGLDANKLVKVPQLDR